MNPKLRLIGFFLFIACLEGLEDQSSLFRDLELVEAIDRRLKDELPFFQNSSMMGGYFNMPSARVPPEGVVAFGASRVHPYNNYGASFQYFDRLELAFNYRVYTGISEKNFGHAGFGDDAERIGNAKFVFNLPLDGVDDLPQFAVGADEFTGTKRFNSQYIVATKVFIDANIEATLGWGRKRIKGFFGGIAWSPWRKTTIPFLKHLSMIAEYDAYDYKHHPHEHPLGRKVATRMSGGLAYVLGKTLQVSLSSHRGREISAMGALRYPLGTSQGFIPKTHEPLLYRAPVDTEPLGVVRPDADFINELGYSFGLQGLDLYRVYMTKEGELWIKIINNMYRQEPIVRDRIQRVLAAITPSNIRRVTVMTEADGVLCQGYHFQAEDLYRYREGSVTPYEIATLSPMSNSQYRPEGSSTLYNVKKKCGLPPSAPEFKLFLEVRQERLNTI